MKCEEVNILLPDYLDKKLTGKEMAAVKEHLRQCADCREELQFLKKYMKEVKSFPSLKPPDNFLDSIHERLKGTERGGMIQKLFVPARFKIPLEAAALVALALTGLIIFKPFKMQELEVKPELPVIGSNETSEQTAPTERRSVQRKQPAMTAKEDTVAGEKKRDADLLRDARVASADSEGPAGISEITLYLKQNTTPAQLHESIAEQKSELSEEKSASQSYLAAKKDKAGAVHSKQAAPDEEYRAGVDSLAALAKSLEGKIIKKYYGSGSAPNQVVIVEIPAANYVRFMKGLRGGWSIQKQNPDAPSRDSQWVRINMNVQN